MTDRPTCCWTHCDNPQGSGTWTEINGEALPVCEDHWYGNLDAEIRHLRDDVERLRAGIEEALQWTDSGGECGQRLYNLLHGDAMKARRG